MRKKDSSSLKSHQLTPANFLTAFAFSNFERALIDSNKMAIFNNFLFNMTKRIAKNSALLTSQTLKTIIDVIAGLEINMRMVTERCHTYTYEDTIRLFINIIALFKQTAGVWNNYQKLIHSDIIIIFWLLLSDKEDEIGIVQIESKAEVLNSLFQNEDVKDQRINCEETVRQLIYFSSIDEKNNKSVSKLFISFLRHDHELQIFKEIIQKYLQQCMVMNHLGGFKKALAVYQHLGNSLQQRRTNLQQLILKTFEFNNCFSYISEINQIYNFSKLFKSQNILKIIVKMTEKVLEKSTLNSSVVSIMEQLSQIDLSNINDTVFRQLQIKFDFLLIRIMDWIISKNYKKQNQPEIKQKNMAEVELKEERIIQFVKNLKNKNGQAQEQGSNNELHKICDCLSIILKKLTKNEYIRSKIVIKDLDALPFLKNTDKINNETIRNFLLQVVPYLLQDFTINPKEKSAIKYIILLRRAEIEAQRLSEQGTSLTALFRQVYFQMIQNESLNYHYVVCFILLKYQKDKKQIRQFLIQELLRDLNGEEKNKCNRNLIVNMSLMLKSLDDVFSSQSIKFKVRQLVKNYQALTLKLDVTQLLTIAPKQLIITKYHNYTFSTKCLQFRTQLNERFQLYNKQNLNLFYFLIIEVNDMIDPDCQAGNQLLTVIKFMRRLNLLKEFYTIQRCLLDILSAAKQQGRGQPNMIIILQIIIKLNAIASDQLKDSEDLTDLMTSLTQYLIALNSSRQRQIISHLYAFKTDKNAYSDSKFSQYLKQAQIVKFYSECSQDLNFTRILITKASLQFLKKMFQLKSSSLNNLPQEIKTLFSIYLSDESPKQFGFTPQHETQLKVYLLLLQLISKVEMKQPINSLLSHLQSNFPVILQLSQQKHFTGSLSQFKNQYPIDFGCFWVTAIKNAFHSIDKQAIDLLKFVVQVNKQDNKINCGCMKQTIVCGLERDIGSILNQVLLKRVRMGLTLPQKQKNDFLANSSILYSFLKKVLQNQKQQLLTIVEDIIQLDGYAQCQQSSYILKQIVNLFAFVQQKSAIVCETIFNYIITLAQIFPGQQKLQISNFICNFFGLSISKAQQMNVQLLERNIPITCSSLPTFRCLKCDERRIFCSGCATNCHKQHPVCYFHLPPELKNAKCQCKDISRDGCKFNNSSQGHRQSIFNPRGGFRSQFPPPINSQNPVVINTSPPQIIERIKYYSGGSRSYPDSWNSPRQRIQLGAFLQEQDLFQNQMRDGRLFQHSLRDQYFPRMGARMERLMDRDQYPAAHAYRAQLDRSEGQLRRLSNNIFQKDRLGPIGGLPNMGGMSGFVGLGQQRDDGNNDNEPQFQQQQYQLQCEAMQVQIPQQMQQNVTILKKHVLLPKFIDLMTSFCNKKSSKDNVLANVQGWNLNFVNPTVSKFLAGSFRLHNAGSFAVDIRKMDPIHNVSCVLIKKSIAQNSAFLVLATGAEMQVYSKQKLFFCASQGKILPGYSPINKHQVTYEIHSLQFSPNDKTLFCASGLHNLALFAMSSQGQIARTGNRYNVSNLYINKIKLAKMGIFIGVQKQIRVLNYSCKHVLTIKPQQANTLIREWSVFEKSAGCQVYFVCPNGNIFFADILPSDEDKKQFTGKIIDQRKTKSGTGASVYVKQVPDLGKYLFASFKDGYNIIGHLQGDQLQDMTDMRLKGIKCDKNIFDTNFIIGHIEIVKLAGAEQLYVVCTVKKYFPPEMSFNQGFLVVICFHKDGNTDIQVVSDQTLCEYFQIFYIGSKHFIIYSVHSDGSLILTTPTKISKAIVDEQVKRMRDAQQGGNGGLVEESKNQQQQINKIRKLLQKHLTLEKVMRKSICRYNFRQNSEVFKSNSQYTLLKIGENQYEFKQINFTKIVTGFSLPLFGMVQLPTRKVQNVFEVGFTTLQALYYYSQGSIKFSFKRNEQNRYSRESASLNNARLMQKMERMERMGDFPEGDRLFNPNMMNSLLGFKEDMNQDICFVGKSFESYKTSVSKFQQFFRIEDDDQSSSIQKTALIIKMFLSRSLKEGNPCSSDQLMQLVEGIKLILTSASHKMFALLKQIILLAVNLYQIQQGRILTIQNDQNYALRAATQNKLIHYYNMLKLDISDEQLNQFLKFILSIIYEDVQLMTYYVAKYSGLFMQLHRRIKKADTEERASALLQIYTFAYPVLKYCEVPCSWMLNYLQTMINSFVARRGIRQKLYTGLKRNKKVNIQPWLKNIGSNQVTMEEADVLNKGGQQAKIQDGSKDQMTQIYNMFSRGEIDEDTLLKMIQQATKIQFERQQQVNQQKNEPQNDGELQPELQLEMQIQQNKVNHNSALLMDLIDDCTDSFNDSYETAFAKIITLYVVSKVVDQFGQVAEHLFRRMKKMVGEIDLKTESDKLSVIMCYSCLFNSILLSSSYLASKGGKNCSIYRQIQQQVHLKLSKVQLETVHKIKNPPNLLPKLLRGEKPLTSINIAYALTLLLLFPCQPSHILLSLECYWLLPQSREYYSKLKDISNIKEGIQSGNIKKVYEIAKNNPQIWQQSNYLQVIDEWIETKRQNWQLALQLLAIYYAQ